MPVKNQSKSDSEKKLIKVYPPPKKPKTKGAKK